MCYLLIHAPMADFLERLHLLSVLLVMDDASLSLAANPLLLCSKLQYVPPCTQAIHLNQPRSRFVSILVDSPLLTIL
jgi:hypothetical protein